jgi:hypothetical protein
MKKLIIFFFIVLTLGGCASTSETEGESKINRSSPDEMLNGITQKHPVTYIQLAAELLKQGQKDEAVVWYYVGQMRYRAHLMANPNLEPSGDPALYSSLKYVVGTPINEYAGSNVENWERLIAKAIEWNSVNENSFTPKDQFPEIYEKIQKEFIEFRNYVSQNKDEIIKQRKENGLSDS